MLVEVRVQVRGIIDFCQAYDPREDRRSVGVETSSRPRRAVLATIDRFPMSRIH